MTKTQDIPTPEELFRTWWVKKPMDEGLEIKKELMKKCGWDYHMWYNRIHGRGKLSGAEKTVIIDVAGWDIFFVDHEGDAMP
jgi:MoaA/NifB/PqqE/SkfB family radical SAM enzyme